MQSLVDRFREVTARLTRSQGLVCREIADCVVSLAPLVPLRHKEGLSYANHDATFDVCFVGGIHGNEIGGLEVLTRFLESLQTDPTNLKNQRVLMAIGNPRAVSRGERFTDCDLNRSFGSKFPTGYEGQRAKVLEPFLLASRFLLDFHQVRRPTPHGFWIFPHSTEGYRFARLVAQKTVMITHWGKGFSDDGQCSDEFMIKNHRIGVTIELGQNGVDELQVNQGLEIMGRSLTVLSQLDVNGESLGSLRELQDKTLDAPLYTWSEIIPYPKTSLRVLDPNWRNFDAVKRGDRLGQFDGHVIEAKQDGLLLFPKYPTHDDDQQRETGIPPAAELVRVIRKIQEQDIGKA